MRVGQSSLASLDSTRARSPEGRLGEDMIKFVILLLAALFASPAQSADWKFYGGSQDAYCFYDEASAMKLASGARIWVECIKQTFFEDDPASSEVIHAAARKFRDTYIPPIVFAQPGWTADKAQLIIVYEEKVNHSYNIKMDILMLYELDCQKDKFRELQISFQDGTTHGPLDWKFIPPDGNTRYLKQI